MSRSSSLWRCLAAAVAVLMGATMLPFIVVVAEPAAAAPPTDLTRTSTTAAGAQASGSSTSPSVAADGRYSVFASSASNLPGANGKSQIYLKDIETNGVWLVSVGTTPGVGANGDSRNPVIAANGTRVAWESAATDLSSGDTNGRWDIYTRALLPTGPTGITTRASVGAGGAQGDGDSTMASITAGGELISFQSKATTLAPLEQNADSGIFVATPSGGARVISNMAAAVNGDPDADPTFQNSWHCQAKDTNTKYFGDVSIGQHAISADGQWVAFVGGWCRKAPLGSSKCFGTYYSGGLFTANTVTGQVIMIADCELDKVQGAACCTAGSGSLIKPAVSPDGGYVVFATRSRDLAWTPPTGGSPAVLPVLANDDLERLQVTSSGGLVSFDSDATNIVAGDTNGRSDAFVAGRAFARLSQTSAGVEGNGHSTVVALNPGGTQAVFASVATNLVPSDTNGASDTFTRSVPAVGSFAEASVPTPPGSWSLSADEFFGDNPAAPNLCWCHAKAGDPVDTATGNFHETFTDLDLGGRGPTLAVTRSYNSLDSATDGPFGWGWSTNLGARLGVDPASGDVTIVQETGARVRFRPRGAAYEAAPWVESTLTRQADGWTLERAGSQTLVFAADGRLLSITDRNGERLTYGYSGTQLTSISDLGGRSIGITWSGNRITQLTDPVGRTVSYSYGPGGNLLTVTDVAGGRWTYGYSMQSRLVTMTRPRQSASASPKSTTNTYDAQGRVTRQTDELGRATVFDYTSVPGATKITDPAGTVRLDSYSNLVLSSTTLGYGSAQAATWTFETDRAAMAPSRVIDPNGRVDRTVTYDAAGNPVTVADALGNTTTTTWTARRQPLTVTDAAGVTTTFAYDARGNVTSVSTPITGGGGSGQATTQYTYGDAAHPGDVTAMTDPRGQTWTYAYGAAGRATSVTDPAGQVTSFAYDAVGRPVSMTTPRGGTVTFTTDAFGRITARAVPGAGTSTSTYDADGNVIAERTPDGQVTTYQYDDAGQRVSVTRPDGSILRTEYRGDRQLAAQVDGAGARTTYAYDALARLVTVTDPLNRATRYTYDAAGNIRTRQLHGGNCAAATPTSCSTYSYDAADRLIGVDHSGSMADVTGITYDAVGRRTAMTDGTGTTTFAWDSLGRLVGETDGAGESLAYAYDPAGNITTITYPGNRSVTRSYDSVGRLASVTDFAGRTTTFGRDADGNATSIAAPNVTTSRAFDTAGRMTAITTQRAGSTVASLSLAWGADSSITRIDDVGLPGPDTTAYGYDALDRLTTANGGAFTFDTADNVASRPDGTRFVSDSANQLCFAAPAGVSGGTCAAPPSGSTVHAYDARGNRTATTPARGLATALGYDLENRLTSARVPRYSESDGQITPLSPQRIYDSRQGVGPIGANSTRTITVTGQGGIPSTGVRAVVLNVTAVNGTAAGFLTAYRTGTTRPGTSDLNYEAGSPVTTSVTVAPGSDGTITLYSANAAVDVAIDVAGYVSAAAGPAGGSLSSTTPTRILDTRTGAGTVVPAGGTVDLQVTGVAGVPTAGATAVLLNVTAVQPSAAGHLSVFPAGEARPSVSQVTYPGGGRTVAGHVLAKIGTGGKVTIYANSASHVVVDLQGWVQAPALATQAAYVPVTPARLVDTRTGAGTCTPSPCARLASGATTSIQVAGVGGVPATEVSAVAVNVTSVGSTGSGQLVAYQTGIGAPTASLLNVDGGRTVTAHGVVRVGTNGRIAVTSTGLSTDVVVDVVGYYSTTTKTWTYTYDGDGLRKTKSSAGDMTSFIWSRASGLPLLIGEKASSGAYTFYLYGEGTAPIEQVTSTGTGNPVWFHHDQIGSVRVATDATGATVGTWTWQPYGQLAARTGSLVTPFGFAGEYRDAETGYVYLRARHYDPVTFRFLSRDPAAAATRTPYGYGGGDPLTGTDPSGLFCITGVKGHAPNGDEICNGAAEVASNVGQWALENRDTIATVGAFAVCVSGVGTGLCLAATGAAYGVRAQKRIEDQGFSNSIGENAADGLLTLATLGLVSWPAGIAENGGRMAVAGGDDIAFKAFENLTPWEVGLLRFGAATPDIAGLVSEPFLDDC